MTTAVTEKVTINIRGAEISVPAERAVHAYLREVLDAAELAEQSPATTFRFTPIDSPETAIGAAYEGGLYVGRLHDGEHLYELIAAPRASELDSIQWEKALDIATGGITINGHSDWQLPTRAEALALFERLHPVVKGTDEAFAETCYWTSQVYERGSAYAWVQSFGNGSQGGDHRDDNYRARFVRRLIIR